MRQPAKVLPGAWQHSSFPRVPTLLFGCFAPTLQGHVDGDHEAIRQALRGCKHERLMRVIYVLSGALPGRQGGCGAERCC